VRSTGGRRRRRGRQRPPRGRRGGRHKSAGAESEALSFGQDGALSIYPESSQGRVEEPGAFPDKPFHPPKITGDAIDNVVVSAKYRCCSNQIGENILAGSEDLAFKLSREKRLPSRVTRASLVVFQ
jgi:hypothetical protein